MRTSLTQILLPVDSRCFQLTVQKPRWQTLWKVVPFHKNSHVPSVMSFCLVLLPFVWFSLLIVLYWVSAHLWHCDLLCCFTCCDTWVRCSLLLLPCSFPDSKSNHNISLKTLPSCSEVHFRALEIFPCFFLAWCYLSQFFLSHRKIWLGKFCSDVWEDELQVSGDKRAAPIGNETQASVSEGETKMLAQHQYQNVNSICCPATERMGNSQCRCKYRSFSIPFYTVQTWVYQKNKEGPRR